MMNPILILLISIIFVTTMASQNIGIGVNDPEYNLDIAGDFRMRHVPGGTSGILFDGVTLPTCSFFGIYDNDRLGIYSNNIAQWSFILNLTNRKIGINTLSPSYGLDVKGRPRLRHSTSGTAGIWFDGSTMAEKSFIGMIDNDHVGLWGNNGAGWSLAMNVNNGNVGIGTQAPTCKFDLAGNFKMRSSFPKIGSIITSEDVNGNAVWSDNIAFKATGGYNDEPNEIANSTNTWYKIYFNQTAAYNYGLAYQTINSQFVAPESGIYHFETVLEWLTLAATAAARIMLNRNGTITEVGRTHKANIIWPTSIDISFLQPSQLSLDIKLLAGDVIWVEANGITQELPTSPTSNFITANNTKTWFSGYLLSRN